MTTRLLLALPLLVLASPAAAQSASAQASARVGANGDVVVTGRRLSETEAALKECIARHCPPDEDIRATLAHAENQFVAGSYKDARATLLASQGRNRGAAKRYPVPVGDLYRASSRVAAHLGEIDSFRVNTMDSLDALKAGLPENDPRVLAQRVEVGDMFAHIGRPDAALEIYRTVARQAQNAKLIAMEGAARLRVLTLLMHLSEDNGVEAANWRSSLPAFDELIGNPDPGMKAAAFVARVMKAQFLARHGDGSQLEAVMAEMKARGGQNRPVLLSSKPIGMPGRSQLMFMDNQLPVRSATSRMPVGSFDKQWADVSFWIKPDGTVSDADILRGSQTLDKSWLKPVLASIGSRRYAPLALGKDDPGLLRVERYTFTAFFDDTVLGTRIRTRSPDPKIEMVDLTDDRPTASRQPAG